MRRDGPSEGRCSTIDACFIKTRRARRLKKARQGEVRISERQVE
jgi:hypothetical protein